MVSQEFIQFTMDWAFKHVTSSYRYPKSNGKAESVVKVAKNLFKKAIKDGEDPWSALLDYRNTPTEGMKSSPFWCQGEHEGCYQQQPAYSTLKL